MEDYIYKYAIEEYLEKENEGLYYKRVFHSKYPNKYLDFVAKDAARSADSWESNFSWPLTFILYDKDDIEIGRYKVNCIHEFSIINKG
jgi:hypothetical protein